MSCSSDESETEIVKYKEEEKIIKEWDFWTKEES